MSKYKSIQPDSLLKKILLILLIISTLLLAHTYYRFNTLNTFLEGVRDIYTIHVNSHNINLKSEVKKIVVRMPQDATNEEIYITNSSLDPQSSIKVATVSVPIVEIEELMVPTTNIFYIALLGGVEGSIDYLVFDQYGKIVIQSLQDEINGEVYENFLTKVAKPRDDGTMKFEYSRKTDSGTENYSATLNMVTGKIKDISHLKN